MKPLLHLKKLSFYTAIKEDCDAWQNLGIIGEGHHGGSPGILNAKKELCDAILKQGGQLLNSPGFVLSLNGRTHSGSGSGYAGWKDFGSSKSAVQYLEQYFTLTLCADAPAASRPESRRRGSLQTAQPDCLQRSALKTQRNGKLQTAESSVMWATILRCGLKLRDTKTRFTLSARRKWFFTLEKLHEVSKSDLWVIVILETPKLPIASATITFAED